jgi:hypothetical protein
MHVILHAADLERRAFLPLAGSDKVSMRLKPRLSLVMLI